MTTVSLSPRGSQGETVCALRAVSKAYANPNGRHVDVLRDVDLDLVAGRLTVLVGRNGVGKSTLLRLAAGLEPPTTGTVYRAADTASRPQVGLMYQEVEESLLPWRTNLGNIAFGLEAARSKPAQARSAARSFVAEHDLPIPLDNHPGTSSGGQRQMVAVVRAAVLRPALLALDEPFSKIDPSLVWRWRRFLVEFVRSARPAALVVTHSLDDAVYTADEICVLDRTPEGSRLLHVATVEVPDDDRHRWRGSAEAQRLRLTIADAVEGTP